MALAAKDLGKATPSCHVRRVGELPDDKWHKDIDKSDKGDPGNGIGVQSNQSEALSKLTGSKNAQVGSQYQLQ